MPTINLSLQIDSISGSDEWLVRNLRDYRAARMPTDTLARLLNATRSAGDVAAIEAIQRLGWIQSDANAEEGSCWRAAGWAAAHDYIRAVRAVRFLDYGSDGRRADIARTSARLATEAPPPPTLSLAGEREYAPRPVRVGGDVALEGTWGRDALLLMLGLAFGKIGESRTMAFAGLGVSMLRTSPSNGARHPLEAFVEVAGVPGLRDGSFHFDAADQALVRLGDAARDEIGVGIALVAVTARSRYRYREPRTYTTLHLEAGHLIETVGMLCAVLGWSCAWSEERLPADPDLEQLPLYRVELRPAGLPVSHVRRGIPALPSSPSAWHQDGWGPAAVYHRAWEEDVGRNTDDALVPYAGFPEVGRDFPHWLLKRRSARWFARDERATPLPIEGMLKSVLGDPAVAAGALRVEAIDLRVASDATRAVWERKLSFQAKLEHAEAIVVVAARFARALEVWRGEHGLTRLLVHAGMVAQRILVEATALGRSGLVTHAVDAGENA